MAIIKTILFGAIFALCGAALAVAGIFPFAAIFALVFRFPFPFAGYQSGWEAALASPGAAHFYMLIGGYNIFPILGALCGIVAYIVSLRSSSNALKWTAIFVLSVDFLAVFTLSIWDIIYGPW